MIIKFLLAVILCELIVEIVIKSELFEPIRNIFISRKLKNRFFWFAGNLLSCGYCFSVWIGVFISVLLNITLIPDFIFNNSYILNLIL